MDRKRLSERHKRILRRVREGNTRTRLRFTKSNLHIYVQAVDDLAQKTLFSSSSFSLKLKNGNSENCKKIASDLSQKLKKLDIKDLCIDRGGSSYHGRIALITDILRKDGFNV